MEFEFSKHIRELPKHVADKIAAGEVVDRPLSIVKELLENAIDAESTSVVIEIKNGGKSYIRLTDNGFGIPANEVELAFKRHATSKIKQADDLNHIHTLGFRGEALASISAVSQTTLITKQQNTPLGTFLRIEGGEIAEKKDTGCPDGTTIIIENLFYNTPARLKFMKTDTTESTLIIDFTSKMALCYPHIKLRLINNGTILFSTPGNGAVYTNILTIYSKQMGQSLISMEKEGEGLRLTGYLSPPDQTKTNRRSQIFFVNGRYITSRLLEDAVTEGYREKLFQGRFPTVFLFLQVRADRLDVNIHPNKKEVRFDDENEIREFVSSAIKQALLSGEAIPQIKHKNGENNMFVSNSINSTQQKEQPFQTGRIAALPLIKEDQVDIKKLLETKRREQEDREQQKQGNENGITLEEASAPYTVRPSFDVKSIHVTGTIFGTYITGSDEHFFYLIDQHAAHERIFYEKLMELFSQEEKNKQLILTPILTEVSATVKSCAESWLPCLFDFGFSMEEFGQKSYAIKEIPSYMSLEEATNFIAFFFDTVSPGMDLKDPKRLDQIISKACKAAVKAHDHLDASEINRLMTDLSQTKNPFTCPHGRPTFIKMSKYEIEKMFKRV